MLIAHVTAYVDVQAIIVQAISYFYILKISRCQPMDHEEKSLAEEEVASICSLRKQVQMLRRLLKESESALAAKRPKKEDKCLLSKKVLVTCGPRDNGQWDYQCMHCGAFL